MELKSFPTLTTERLLLREIKLSDSDVILFLRSDETVTKFIERPENRKTRNIADARKFIKEIDKYFQTNRSITWGITLKNDPGLIGTICLWNFSKDHKIAEVGYDLDPKFQKQGIMNEALKETIRYAFQKLKLEKIEAFTHNENHDSKRLLGKNGFRFVENRKDLNNESNVIFELNSFM